VRDWDAQVAFEQALANLRRLAGGDGVTLAGASWPAPAVAVFSSASAFTPSKVRRRFFEKVCAAGWEVWQFVENPDGKLGLVCDRRRVPSNSLPARESNPGPRRVMNAPSRVTLSPGERA